MKERNTKKVVWSILLAIIIAAFALRFAKIDAIPSSIYPDEAQNGVDAQIANKNGSYKWFYETNNGREGLFINLQAMSIKTIGNTVIGLKIWSIIFGTLTVLGMFFLGSELFQTQVAGLLGAYLTAFSYWAINFSRIGFRAIMLPFILTWAFYFLFRGLRTKKFHDFIIAGFIYGLGLHTYIAFRVSPLVLIILFIALLIVRKDFLKQFWKHTIVFAIAMFIAAMPMLLDFFVFHPEHYTSRTSEISVLNSQVNHGRLLPTVARTFALSLGKYNFWGDQNMRQNYPPYPILNPLTGLAFLAGLIYTIGQFFRLAWKRFKSGSRDTRLVLYAFLLAWFFTLLIPEFLANEGNPHALRSIGTLPVVMLLATMPILWLIKKYHSFGHAFKIFYLSAAVILLLFIALFDPIKYFVFFADNPKQHGAFEANLKETTNYLNSLPASTEKIVITGSMQRLPIEYLNPTMPNLVFLYPGQTENMTPSTQDFQIIFTDSDWQTINAVRDQFPNINFEQHTNKFGDTFYVLKY